jgi:hypothetical protein
VLAQASIQDGGTIQLRPSYMYLASSLCDVHSNVSLFLENDKKQLDSKSQQTVGSSNLVHGQIGLNLNAYDSLLASALAIT